MTDIAALNGGDNWRTRAEGEQAESRPYLGVHSVEVHVRDQDQSLKFYVEKLGFLLLVDAQIDAENRCIAVAPPDHSAVLALIKAPKGPGESLKIGRRTGVTLVTDNIAAKFQEWSVRGVRFGKAPTLVPWGIHATFEDIDGNQFDLLQSPWLIDFLNAVPPRSSRRPSAARLTRWKSRNRSRRSSSRRGCRHSRPSSMRGDVCRLARSAATITTSSLLYTDGITEAASDDGREFGEEGLIEVLRAERHLPVERLLGRILEKVRRFSNREQEDDITLVVARCHPAGE